MPHWSDDEVEALSQVKPYDRAGLAAFRERFPRISRAAAQTKLMKLRIQGRAVDVDLSVRGDPFPAYRFD